MYKDFVFEEFLPYTVENVIGAIVMQAVLNTYKSVVDELEGLVNRLSDADNTLKNEIENKIVQMGSGVVNSLVNILPNVSGPTRGVVAMSLIRIGEDAIEPLKQKATTSKDFQWVANYLISEIG